VIGAGLLLALLVTLFPWPASGLEIGPEESFCARANALSPGEDLVLRPGDYRGPCAIRRGGQPGAPIVIRGADPERRPRIVYTGRASNVIEVRTSHVTIRGLEFGPTLPDIDAIRIFGGGGVTVEGCRFSDLGGIAVVANHGSVSGLTVRRNEILFSGATAMYFGCHDGQGCVVDNLLVERNYIRRVTAVETQVGYGVQFKLNTTGTIRDNVIVDTKGPGIMVYGATQASRVSLIERNLVIGSRESSGIVAGGGPAVIRNNIAVDHAVAGVAIEDYRKRGLVRGLVVAHNTLVGNGTAAIVIPENGTLEATIAANAVVARAGAPAPVLPPARAGLTFLGNVDCTGLACFIKPELWDFSPAPGSPLAGAGGVQDAAPWSPRDDFFGGRRGASATVGAVERAAGPLLFGIRP
jgi:hypothetical protein